MLAIGKQNIALRHKILKGKKREEILEKKIEGYKAAMGMLKLMGKFMKKEEVDQ